MNHLMLATEVTDKQFCGALCFLEDNCMSYNLITGSEAENHKCELNNATHEGHESDLVDHPGCIYRAAKVKTISDVPENLLSPIPLAANTFISFKKAKVKDYPRLFCCYIFVLFLKLIIY